MNRRLLLPLLVLLAGCVSAPTKTKLSRDNERARIDIVESEFTCGLVNGCVSLGFKEDVATWLSGNTTCRDISKTLLSLGLGL
jgi:hypothetical protein